MYLKTLTLKGFKSFASTTELSLEPGITCVVGPNGSGKSNVVDALAWVMGEQGVKTLRGSKMDDVIFAGSDGKSNPLGRAEVSLTIDNTSGLLPIEFTEITIKRTMFRGGGSEYEINGEKCRLLDIQELLSDTGLGQQMHVIVGQGRLDRILQASAIERRGFIEEAAGVLKHRKRKEKAVNKLEGMQVNLNRLTDLAAEVRRQLGPLGRQADVAKRANVILANVRDAKSRLLADDFIQLDVLKKQGRSAISEQTEILNKKNSELEVISKQISELESQMINDEIQIATERLYKANSLSNKLVSLNKLAIDRESLLKEPVLLYEGIDPKQIENSLKSAKLDLENAKKELAKLEVNLADVKNKRESKENEAQTLSQKVNILRQSENQKAENFTKLDAQKNSLIERKNHEEENSKSLNSQINSRKSEADALNKELLKLTNELSSSNKEADALEKEFLKIKQNYEKESNLVEQFESAISDSETQIKVNNATIESFKEAIKSKVGTKDVKIKKITNKTVNESLKTISVNFANLTKETGEDFLVASNKKVAKLLVESTSDFTVISTDGEILFYETNNNSEKLVPLHDKIDELESEISKINAEIKKLNQSKEKQIQVLEKTKNSLVLAEDKFVNFKKSVSQKENDKVVLESKINGVVNSQNELNKNLEKSLELIKEFETRIGEIDNKVTVLKTANNEEEDLQTILDLQATAEVEVGKLRESEQTASSDYAFANSKSIALEERVKELNMQLESEMNSRETAKKQQVQREAAALKAKEVQGLIEILVPFLNKLVENAKNVREEILKEQTKGNSLLSNLRTQSKELRRTADELVSKIHKLELDFANLESKTESLNEKAELELNLTKSVLVKDFSPELPILTPNPEDESKPIETKYIRSEQVARLKKAERELTALGKVNPLALEEFQALEERHKYLTDQLQDIEKSRKDLLELIGEIDSHTIAAFMSAFEDTAKEFEQVFSVLFPGGNGKMFLTDPEDPLTTGIEIHATPAGKRISRLSLLSGGERSLVAVAMLVAIFKARPSPFYVMDEVEAALDDVNLSRLLTIFKDLKKNSQLLIVTHQKRTMEVADSLYGITMRKDGITQVISQKLDSK